MVAFKIRKVLNEIVQVDATLTDRNLWISQGRMCWKEIYKLLGKSLRKFLKIRVDLSYFLIGSVIDNVQPL